MQKYFEVTTTDKSILKADIIRQIVDRKAETMMTGKNAVMMEDMESLDIKFNVPTAIYFEPEEVAEGAGGPKSVLKWFDVAASLKKYENGFVITHEVKARQMQGKQVAMAVDRCARGQAFKMDKEIFTTLAAASADNTAATAVWNHASSAKPADDIATTVGKILDTTTITDEDISNVNVFYPAKLWGHLAKPVEVNNIQKTIRSFVNDEFKVNLFPTRQLTTTALVVLKSMETAQTMTYTGSAVPRAFFKTDNVGDDYTFHRYFRTVVIPDVENGTTNARIQTITGVA